MAIGLSTEHAIQAMFTVPTSSIEGTALLSVVLYPTSDSGMILREHTAFTGFFSPVPDTISLSTNQCFHNVC